MNSALLGRYYPLNLLSPMGLDELCAGVKIQTYGDGDYIYRVWDESDDLLYVIDGKVLMLEQGQGKQIIITNEDNEALRPFSHSDSKIEAAIARHDVKVLKVDFELFSSLLARDSGKDIEIKIKRNTVSAEKSNVRQSNEVEPIELPDFDDLDIELKPVKTTPPDFSRRKAVNREQAHAKPVRKKTLNPKPVAKVIPTETEKLHDEPAEAKPVARPARFTRNSASPAKIADKPAATARSNTRAVPEEPIRALAGKEPKQKADVEVIPDVQKKTDAKSKPVVKPAATKGAVEKFLSKVKEELTEERRFDLKLVKSAEETEEAKPVKLKVEQGLIEKLKHELTAERKLDLKLVKSAAKPEPVNQLSEIDQYLNAMVLYREGKWPEAHSAFLALTIDHPSTNLYMIYASKCSELISDENLRTG